MNKSKLFKAALLLLLCIMVLALEELRGNRASSVETGENSALRVKLLQEETTLSVTSTTLSPTVLEEEMERRAQMAASYDTEDCNKKMLRAIESRGDFEAYAKAFVNGVKLDRPLPTESTAFECQSAATKYLEPVSTKFVFKPRSKSQARPLVFDTFTFSTEVQLVLLRMETLQDVVDYFVVAESNMTFTNQAKPLHFKDNLPRFHKFRKQILLLHVNFPPKVQQDVPFAHEFYTREELVKFAVSHSKNPDDIIIHSDVDEIPTPFLIRLLRDCRGTSVDKQIPWQELPSKGISFHTPRFHADLACYARSYQPWWGVRVHSSLQAKTLGGYEIRQRRTGHPESTIFQAKEAGWHLSYVPLGETSFLRDKFATFSHANDGPIAVYKSISDGEWSKQVVEGMPAGNGDYACDRLGKKMLTAPSGAFAYMNEFGPFMSDEQKALGNYIREIVCPYPQ